LRVVNPNHEMTNTRSRDN